MSTGRARAAAHDPYGIAAAQADLDARIATRNADIVALAADGMSHALIADTAGVTRSYVSRLVREAAQQAHHDAWGAPSDLPAVRDTYAARITRARQEWEAMRDAQEAQLMREGAGADRREETRAMRGSDKVAARDNLLLRIPTWAEWKKTASLTYLQEQAG